MAFETGVSAFFHCSQHHRRHAVKVDLGPQFVIHMSGSGTFHVIGQVVERLVGQGANLSLVRPVDAQNDSLYHNFMFDLFG